MKINKTFLMIVLCLFVTSFLASAEEPANTLTSINDKIVNSSALSKIYGTENIDIIKESVFTNLKINDGINKEAVFTADNSITTADTKTIASLDIKFKEICGTVTSYQLVIPKTCYQNNTYCYDEYTDETNKTFLKNTCKTNTISFSCDETIKDIKGIKDYKVKATIRDGNCLINNTYYRYIIDWMPELTVENNQLVYSEWAVWNATGGTVTTYLNGSINVTVHTFTSNGTFALTGDINASILVVAGGGGGGCNDGAGGGAGGLIYNASMNLTTGGYTVIVGSGGIRATVAEGWHQGGNGSNSSFNGIVTKGGGGGAGSAGGYTSGLGGGSGGGATGGSVGTGIVGQGNNGGTGSAGGPQYGGGGGGGAGGVGGTGSTTTAGNGGIGINYTITGSTICYAGGGGGGAETAYGNGTCGGGRGRGASGAGQTNGTDGLGGGAGGGCVDSVGAGDGGDGVVIIAYQTSTKSLNFVSQSPSDLLSTTLFGNNLNITYSYAGYTSYVPLLNYTVLSGVNNCLQTVNGTCTLNNNTAKYAANISSSGINQMFTLEENELLPSNRLYDEQTLEHATKLNYSFGSNNNYILMTFKNFTNTTYSFFEAYLTTSISLISSRAYFCNNNYDFSSSIITNPNCVLFNSFSETTLNHTHNENSSHNLVSIPVNASSNKINGISITNPSYIILRGSNTGTINLRYANTLDSGQGIVRTTNNNGLTWTNQSYTPDVHIHQFSGTSRVVYIGIANESGVITTADTNITDNYDLTLLKPSAPIVNNPYNASYLKNNGNISIDWQASNSINLNGYITYYNISLYDSLGVFNYSINSNTTSNPYSWNASNFTNGFYYIRLEATDNYSEKNFDYSEQFLLNNCTENWISNYTECRINDTMLLSYYDDNSCGTSFTLPVDNGTEASCNYCTEDLTNILGECINGTQTSSWFDNNFFTCCAITGLTSDCSVMYPPYYPPETLNCSIPTDLECDDTNLTQNFTCRYDPNPLLKEKMNLVCIMPDNESYECVVNVFQSTNLLATTPEYREASDSIFNLKGQGDTRTYFTPERRLLNAFYTNKNIITDTEFKVEVLCSSDIKDIVSEICIIPEYEPPNFVNNRMVWARENAPMLIVGFFIIVFVAGLVYYVRKTK